MNQVRCLTQMAQASRVLAVATPNEGHRATTEGTGSEKATKCKYSTTQREEGHRAKGMPSKATQGKGNFIAVGAMSVEAERNNPTSRVQPPKSSQRRFVKSQKQE